MPPSGRAGSAGAAVRAAVPLRWSRRGNGVSAVELYLRLAGATALLLLPGALLAQGLGLGGLSSALVLSLAGLAVALAFTFLVHGSLWLALALYGLFGVGALVLAVARRRHRPREGRAELLVVAAGVAFGIALWHVAGEVQGDGLFHLARVRKLEAFDSLRLRTVDEFRDGGLHPGYAFPLWHGFLAGVARLAGVDPEQVVRHEPSLLVPVAFAVAYEAGYALFRSAWAAVAVVLAAVAPIALAPGGGGAYRVLALPATSARQLLVPAALALVFAFLETPRLALAAAITCAGLVLAFVHVTYALFLLLPLVGFLVARAALERRDLRWLAGAMVAFAVPVGAVLLWLLPIARETVSYGPTEAVRCGFKHGIRRYPGQFDVWSCDRFRLAPEVLGRTGSVAVAALVLVPLAALASRRRFAAFVLGGTVLLLAVLLVPSVFVRFADTVSVSQARRAAGFVPLPFAFAAGGAVVTKLVGVLVLPLAVAAGLALQLAWPGDFGYRFGGGGPAVATWIAAVGGAAALVAVALLRRPRLEESRGPLVALAAALFVVPVAWHGLARLDPPRPGAQLPAGVVRVLRDDVPRGAVVFGDPETSFLVAAEAPVYVAAGAPAHVADTTANRPYERARDAHRFLRHGDLAIPRSYGARWIVLDRRRTRLRLRLPKVWGDARYTFYRLR